MLWREHLDRPADGSDDEGLLDVDDAVASFRDTAERLDAWHHGGRHGPRPPGRARPHRPELLGRPTKAWAFPLYRTICDPDGRPLATRYRRRW